MLDEPNADFALLTSVPEEHLISGLAVCAAKGKVAFGSDAGMVLSDFAFRVGADAVADVLIYASESRIGGIPKATYLARWVGLEGSKDGYPTPAIASIRPPSTVADGKFLSFWIVSDLRKLDASAAIEIRKLRTRGSKKTLASNYIPLGPIIIEPPF